MEYCPFCKKDTLVLQYTKNDPHGYPMEEVWECTNGNCGNELRQPVT